MSDTTEYQQLIEAVRHMREWQKQHPGAPWACEQLAAAEQSVDIALAQQPAPSAEAPAEIWDYEVMTVGGEWVNESRANGPPDTELFVIRNLTKRAALSAPASSGASDAVRQPLTQCGWIDEFGNVYPMGAWVPTKRTWHDGFKERWQPVYRATEAGTTGAQGATHE